MKDLNSYKDFMEKCSHCSYCEATCPVFLEDLLETHVARARMELIKEVLVNESMPVTDRFKEVVDRCLLCTNCKQTCPADVPVDEIVIAARQKLYNGKRLGMIKRQLLNQVMENRGIKGAMGKMSTIAKSIGMKNIPKIPEKSFEDLYKPGTYPADGETRAKVVYFVGCATNTIYPETGDAVMKVLKRNGIEVIIPEGLTCCGIPAIVEGDITTAEKLVKNNVEILSGIEADMIITDCTSCGMTFKEKIAGVLGIDGDLGAKITQVASKISEVTDFMAEKGFTEEIKPVKAKVTYHIPCHKGWAESLKDAPRKIMGMIPDLEIVEMENPEKCCGAGGTFYMENGELSGSIRSKKTEDIVDTKAEIVVTQCPSCRSYIGEGLDGIRVMHPMALLNVND